MQLLLKRETNPVVWEKARKDPRILESYLSQCTDMAHPTRPSTHRWKSFSALKFTCRVQNCQRGGREPAKPPTREERDNTASSVRLPPQQRSTESLRTVQLLIKRARAHLPPAKHSAPPRSLRGASLACQMIDVHATCIVTLSIVTGNSLFLAKPDT